MPSKKRLTLNWLGQQDWLALSLWFGMSIVIAARELIAGETNNFIIFRHVFLHVRAQQNLYMAYPEYFDVNNYGPVFSVIIAPFALLPFSIGAMLWVAANALFLYYAIRQLPITRFQQNLVLIFASHELMAASSYFQFNVSIAACIILSFALILRGKDFWAAFFIVIGTLTKLYGIVGLAFFFFSKHRWRLIGSMLLWGVVLFVLPMALSSAQYIINTYKDWWTALVVKNQKNFKLDEGILLQNISAQGIIQRVFRLKYFSNLWVLVPALLLFASHYLRLRWKENVNYCLYLLASVLLFTVIFSTSSESPTYIIAFLGTCIWYVLQKPTKWVNAFFIFALIGTSFSHSDLVTPWVKHHFVVPYALKALPSVVMWLVIVWQILSKQFLRLEERVVV
ncbi:DUF2029 domain-containing protein [Chitinophaga agrisoli]|uniref:DUF2029 domain-containing protein n=1 Tax=Chitinophaga agrisoli TaxID=2607653 RepID=A0A5B2VKU3_9BACT|nr:glycosyltransferase family 87 protein [Chitinophaga agrisoli]KAA2238912.1 DUF2029 domain-containing protein [Chitinophaga agrisoli]